MKRWEEDYYTCECIVRVPQTELLVLAALRDPQQENKCGVCGRECAVIRRISDSSDGAGN